MERELLTRNIEDIIVKSELTKKLKSGKKLRIKYGVDVTAPELHIGHAVNLWKMRQFQDMGHKVVFLIGDFTTRIGDPTGKNKTRPIIHDKDIRENTELFIKQAKMILRFDDPKLLEIRRNSEWYDKMKTADFLKLLTMITHARLVERDMFQERIQDHKDLYMHELIYPILQGWDSAVLKSDLTIIGSDQLFNEMLGRFYQVKSGQKPQVIITTTITPGIDGKEKQSKSLGNYIGLTHEPFEKYGRIMSMPDELIISYYKTYTNMPLEQIEQIEKDMAMGDNPRDTKAALAHRIVERYHGEKVASQVQTQWDKQFRNGEKPTDIEICKLTTAEAKNSFKALAKMFGLSTSEIRRKVKENGIRVNSQVFELDQALRDGDIIQLGKRRFKKIIF
ncbi:MAG: tyrosine--tRNA ligase [bacterium]|nr:tyrosine--tRNA ligase [bacterium]